MNRRHGVRFVFVAVAMLAVIVIAASVPFTSILPEPGAVQIAERFRPPSAEHILGTDALGRDVMARLLVGARISLLVAVVAAAIATTAGLMVGGLAGFCGGIVDSVLMRLTDMMLAFPSFFLVLTLASVLEPSIWHVVVVIGFTSWMTTARVIRAEVLRVRELTFVQAARAMGAHRLWILRRHILPAVAPLLLVSASLGIAFAMLTEAGLSFIGLGVQPPTPSWGAMLAEGRTHLVSAWWLTAFPGLAIVVAVSAFNLLGHGLGVLLTTDKGETE